MSQSTEKIKNNRSKLPNCSKKNKKRWCYLSCRSLASSKEKAASKESSQSQSKRRSSCIGAKWSMKCRRTTRWTRLIQRRPSVRVLSKWMLSFFKNKALKAYWFRWKQTIQGKKNIRLMSIVGAASKKSILQWIQFLQDNFAAKTVKPPTKQPSILSNCCSKSKK